MKELVKTIHCGGVELTLSVKKNGTFKLVGIDFYKEEFYRTKHKRLNDALAELHRFNVADFAYSDYARPKRSRRAAA